MFRHHLNSRNRNAPPIARPAGEPADRPAFDPTLMALESRTVMSGTGFHNAIDLHINSASGEASTNGLITATGHRFYRFTADQDGLTGLTITPRIPLNATLEVFDSSGRLIARPALRAGAGQAEGMLLDAFEGEEYFVRVVGESRTRGRFTLDIDGAREMDVSHGDVSVRDRLDFRYDTDGWNFTPDRSGHVTITVDPTGSLNAQIRVYDEDGRQITPVIDRVGSGGSEVVTLNVRAGDAYRVLVSGRSGAWGNYSITFDPGAGYGGGGNPWSTPISSTASARIDFIGDEDLFSFTASRNGIARVIADPRYGLDAVLRVYGENGSLIASHDRTGSGGTEVIDFQVFAGRDYFIVVDGFRNSTGDYTLTLQAPTAPPPALDDHADAGQWYDATRIPILASSGNGLAGGAIEATGDTDLFKFTVAGTGTLRMRINPLNSSSSGLDAVARLYDSRGVLIAQADSGGSGDSEWLTLTAYRGETLFLVVDGYGSSRGSYDVEIDGPAW